MSNKKAPGASQIRKEDFEIAGDTLDNLVRVLSDKICMSGIWPEVMKTQIVCPLPKNPSKKDIIEEDETRPISLLETLDKWIQGSSTTALTSTLNTTRSRSDIRKAATIIQLFYPNISTIICTSLMSWSSPK